MTKPVFKPGSSFSELRIPLFGALSFSKKEMSVNFYRFIAFFGEVDLKTYCVHLRARRTFTRHNFELTRGYIYMSPHSSRLGRRDPDFAMASTIQVKHGDFAAAVVIMAMPSNRIPVLVQGKATMALS